MSQLAINDIPALTAVRSTADALALFDELPTVDLDFMVGRWQGAELETNHPIEGLLDAISWYGKEFIEPDHVHPLLCSNLSGGTFSIKPVPFMMNLSIRFAIFRHPMMKPINRVVLFFLKTKHTQARMRMLEHRGKTSATMIYDGLPIHDTFRQLDERTLMGVMDFKGVEQPYFFVLRREGA